MAEIVQMPKLGFDMAEGTLVRWVKVEGESVNKGDVLAEIETDKATVEVESSFSGLVHKHLIEEGSVVPVGTPIAVIAQPGEEVKDLPLDDADSGAAAEESKPEATSEAVKEAQTQAVEKTGPDAVQPSASDGRIIASPLARRIAEEKNLDLATVSGSGPGGRIVKSDVEQALSGGILSSKVDSLVSSGSSQWQPIETKADQTVKMSKLRSIIGKRMLESKQTVPHFYVTHTVDMEALFKLRKQVNALLPEDQKISVNDFVVKAAALALQKFPNLNASIVEDSIVQHGSVNVGVAVAVEGGLLTVVCRDADRKQLRRISEEITEMVNRARDGKVKTDDIEGSTFSISNLGMYDVDHFSAIINAPEAAILAVSSAKQVPVVLDGEIKVGLRMQVTLSADHRITDGVEAALFLQSLAGFLENPVSLML